MTADVVAASLPVTGRGWWRPCFLQQTKPAPNNNAKPATPPMTPPTILAVFDCDGDVEDEVEGDVVVTIGAEVPAVIDDVTVGANEIVDVVELQ